MDIVVTHNRTHSVRMKIPSTCYVHLIIDLIIRTAAQITKLLMTQLSLHTLITP
jgi:hypothetical protein